MNPVTSNSAGVQQAQIVIESVRVWTANPLVLLCIFVVASLLMIWRLEVMERKGFEGTVLGTLIMPYCSGFPNLVFAYVMSRSSRNGAFVIENCIVNNVTNLSLILGLAAIFGVPSQVQKAGTKKKSKPADEQQRINGLNVLFSLVALFLFTGALWALAKDGVLDFYDGLVLVALFVFWQILHVFEILKNQIRKNQTFQRSIVLDLILIALSAYAVYYGVDHLVSWVAKADNPFFSFSKLGWFSGLLMVLPNAFIALYYARRGRQDIVLSSQIGDGHICIPMCIGLFALFNTIQVPALLQTGVYVIAGAGVVHFLSIAVFKRVPRLVGFGLLGAYAFFCFKGIVH